MPIHYKIPKHAQVCDEPSLTEQEHKDACDINKMLKAAARGQAINGSLTDPRYGYDDTTLDATTLRIQKQQLEEQLSESSKITEFTEQEFAIIPESIKQKFGFKMKTKSVSPNSEAPKQETQSQSTNPKPDTNLDSLKTNPKP